MLLMMSDTTRPMTPTIIRISPMVLRLKPSVWTLTANFRIAPTAMRTIDVPMAMSASLQVDVPFRGTRLRRSEPELRGQVIRICPARRAKCGSLGRPERRSPRGRGGFAQAAEGTRTLDLLHGKQTL